MLTERNEIVEIENRQKKEWANKKGLECKNSKMNIKKNELELLVSKFSMSS